MQIIHSLEKFRKECSTLNRSLGLVPTMGAIHDGHLALIKQASIENKSVVVTIFVNPKQFSENEDFDDYPRPIHSDIKSLEAENVDLVFTPSTEEMYPSNHSTHVSVGEIAKILEGKSRPDHFQGVSTIVTKLISASRPDNTYFGQKDAQQCAIVQKLNNELTLGTNMRIVPTVRENCRLQSFPDTFEVHGTKGSQNKQIGNAVPVLLAKVLAEEIYDQIKGN